MTCLNVFKNSDTDFRIDNLTNSATGEFVNNATVSVSIVDANGVEVVASQSMTYIAGSDGSYRTTISAPLEPETDSGVATIVATASGVNLSVDYDVDFTTYSAATMEWSSRRDLDMMFGKSNITTWADLENEGDADLIADRVAYVIQMTTDDVKTRLAKAPCDVGSLGCVPSSLRLAVTRLAGVLLYESRGVKDTDSDGSVVHRLVRYEKLAKEFLNKVIAGQIELCSDGAETVPSIIPHNDLDSDADVQAGEEIFG